MATSFRKKPVVIEAMQWAHGNSHYVWEWMGENLYPFLVGNALEPSTLRYPDQIETDDSKPDKGCYIDPGTGNLVIRTLEGDMRVSLGDWVIRGIQGEFYPCKPDIFEATYEVVEAEVVDE